MSELLAGRASRACDVGSGLMPDLESCLIYQHQDWLLVNKPCGFSVQQLYEAWQLASPSQRYYPVHRLDKETSGLWLLAKNEKSNQQLSLMFQEKSIQKAYLAITEKKPRKKQGKIIGDMARSRRSQWQLLKSRNRPAITLFRSVGLSDGLRLVLCRPVTGKTHQIRVAMKSLGSPIAGDRIYSAQTASDYKRCYLHAFALEFEWSGELCQFQLLPDDGDLFLSAKCQQQLQRFLQPFSVLS